MRKKFSQELFDENDDACRNAAEYIKEDLGIDALEDNPNKYGVDLIGTLDGEFVSYVEVERKHGWKGETFPFSTVNLPARKKKYVELILPTQFVIFNHDFSCQTGPQPIDFFGPSRQKILQASHQSL